MSVEAVETAAPIHAKGPKKLPPMLSGGLPVLGHTLDFLKDTTGLLKRARKECGPVARFRVVGKDMVLLTGPEVHEEFFRAPDEQLSSRVAYQMMVPVFGKGVAYDNEPGRMMEQLHMLLPALQAQRMRTYGEIVAKEVDLATKDWGESGEVDFYEFTGALTNFTSSACLLGKEFREELSVEFSKVYYDLERSIVPLVYIHPHLPLPVFFRRDRARARLGEMVSSIVQRRKKSGYVGEDFLQTLMDSRYKDGSSLSDHEITGMLVAAMFAGHHTSSVTTAWTMLELLQHPDEMKKVRDELERVYQKGEEVTFQSLRELHQTERAVKEALRLHPPLFILLRAVMYDFEVGGYTVPKGAWVVVSPLVAHLEENLFSSASRFEPDRYAPGRAEDAQAFAYIPFGGGRHKCMGNAFAILQIKTIFAILLRRYEFELTGDPIEPDFHGLVVGPKRPCRIRYRRIR